MKPAELKKARESLGLSQGRLAHTLKVSRVTVNRWERGKRRIPDMLGVCMDLIRALAEYYRRDARERQKEQRWNRKGD